MSPEQWNMYMCPELWNVKDASGWRVLWKSML